MDSLPDRIGKYVIRDLLGAGGMGRVYRAYDQALDREVALKVIHPHRLGSERALARFANEARALARLSSPHVVQIFDFQPGGDEPWLVMELVDGRSLSRLLRDGGPQSLRRIVDCGWQTLAGLAAAHAAGIIHRDIKPGNVLLSHDGVYKLADFGLVPGRLAGGEDLTTSGEVVGTLRYLAPEVAAGGEASASSDCYSLAITLYELAVGRHPIDPDDNPLRLARRIIETPLRPITVALPDVPPGLAAWFVRMLAHDRDQRFADAGVALAALRACDLPAGTTNGQAPTTRHEHGSVVPEPLSATATSLPLSDLLKISTGSSSIQTTGTSRPASDSGLRLGVPPLAIARPRMGFLIRLILAIWLLASAASLLVGWLVSRRAIDAQFARFRQEMSTVAAGATLMIDGEAHGRLAALGARAPEDPAYAILLESLQRYRSVHPEVAYIYTMTRLPDTDSHGVVAFVCDASDEIDRNTNGVIDPDEIRAVAGQRYDIKDAPDLAAGFARPAADQEYVRDQWGRWLSGYAPIRDQQGEVTGLVGVDLPATHIDRLQHDFIAHGAILLVSTLAAFLAAAALVAMRMRRPIMALQRGLLEVARGNLDTKVEVTSADEFRLLADAFNHMIAQLREAIQVRICFEDFIARALDERLRQGAGRYDGAQGARLYCEFHGGAPGSDTGTLSGMLTVALPTLFEVCRAYGGLPERVIARGVLVVFPRRHPEDHPQEHAVRAALSLLARLGGDATHASPVTIGIAIDENLVVAEQLAIRLGSANRGLGTDLLVAAPTYLDIRTGFYADRILTRDERTGQTAIDAFAVKGAVSVGNPWSTADGR